MCKFFMIVSSSVAVHSSLTDVQLIESSMQLLEVRGKQMVDKRRKSKQILLRPETLYFIVQKAI